MAKGDLHSASVADRIDRDLAAAALRKRQSGQRPKSDELAALRRVERAEEEKRRREYLSATPKWLYREMSGRADKVLLEQAARYDLPLRGKSVDLFAVIRAFHDFLAQNKHKLAAPDEALLGQGAETEWLERYREERTYIARLERQRLEGRLLPRDAVHDGLTRIGLTLRRASERIQRDFGAEPFAVIEEALDEAQREIDRLFRGPEDETAAETESKTKTKTKTKTKKPGRPAKPPKAKRSRSDGPRKARKKT